MISDNVPREAGLDAVVSVILRSRNPLHDISNELGHLLYPEELIRFRSGGLTAKEFIELMESERKEFIARGIIPSYGYALGFIREGEDYLTQDRAKIRERNFWDGDELYRLILPDLNAYNPSFGISLFPEETTTIPEKKAMMDEFGSPRYPRGYNHVKTLLLYDKRNNKYYLVIVPGDQMANLKNIKRELGVGNLRFSDDPREIVGRESGAISHFVQEQYFPNIERILVAEDLLIGYTKPHYSIPLDRRSAIVLADIRDLINVLRRTEGFPQIVIYNN